MPKKSKGFQNSVKPGQNSQKNYKMMKSLKSKMSEGVFGELGAKVVIEPKGVSRMSEALHDFVAPYLKPEYNAKRRKALFTLGAIAWNAALMSDHQQMFDKFLSDSLLNSSPENQEEARQLIDELIARKIKHFPDINRLIVNFELTETTKDDYHLAVASTEFKNLQAPI